MIPNPDKPSEQILEPLYKMTEGNKKQYIADVRHSRLIDEFDKFAAKEGESLESVYERLTTLMNIMDRNNVHPIPVLDKSETLGKPICVTPLNTNTAVKAKKASNIKVNTDTSKPVTSHSTPKNEQKSSNSVRRQKSKDTKSKNRVLKNTHDKSLSVHVQKVSSSVSIDSNKRKTMNSNVYQSNASLLNTKTVNADNDSLNIVCVSCGKDVFMLSHEKCVARYALSRFSRVKRALFATPVAAKSKNLGATFVVAKSRFSVAKTPTTTNKVSSALSLSPDSSQSRTLT
ncbi:hypothetical protein Tco_1228700 [Tanacetum coccineum]